MLRRGSHHSVKFWRRALLPVIERYRHVSIPKFFRGGAAFANPALYRVLEKEGYYYAIRITANAVLERKTRFGDEEAGVEVCRKGCKMLDFFADSPIPTASIDQSS